MPEIIFSPKFSIFIIFAIVVFAMAMAFYTYRVIHGRIKSMLLALRLSAILVILFILLQPSISIIKEKIEKDNFIFLLDNSGSMGIVNENKIDRLSRVKGLFKEEKFINNLSKKNNLHFYSFSNKLNKINIDDIEKSPLRGTEGALNTDFSGVIKEVNKSFNGLPVSGIFILSDGIDNHPGNTTKIVDGNNSYPIFTVSPGEEKGLKDISIYLRNSLEKADLDKKLTIDFVVESFGFGTKNIPCSLKEDGIEIKRESFSVKPGKNILFLEFTPGKAGPHRYLISLAAEAGEATLLNNEEEFYLDVKKEKLYVLVLSGAPSLEYKFLHKYFTKEPNIKATFLVAKDNGKFIKLEENDGKDYFPDKKDELLKYDLIIFNNIERKKIPESSMPWIKEFVSERGGGVLMLGGKKSFQGGGYNGSPIEDVLPVIFNKEDYSWNEGKFLPELTGDGKIHLLTQLDPDSVKNTKIWKEFPVLEGYNIVRGAKSGAQVLAVHPADKNKIIWAVQPYGRGRTMAIMADDLWKWDFLMAGIGKTSEQYDHFYSRIVSWLTSVKGDVIDVETDKFVYSAGENINLMASVRRKDLTSFEINSFIKEKNAGNNEVINFAPYSGAKDLFKAEYRTSMPGEFDITVEAVWNKGPSAEGLSDKVVKKIFVKKDLTEWRNIKTDEKFLKEISEKTGGKFYRIEELNSKELDNLEAGIKGGSRKVKMTYVLTLWDNVFIFCLFIILLASEWYLRKVKGLN